MKLIFWISLAGILYTYLGYPFAIWLFAHLRPRPWTAGAITPSVSIVLAVHNGIALLPRKIEQLLNLDYQNIHEIIVVSDGSTDGTAEFLAQQTPRITSIILEQHAGKAVAVNAGVRAATSEIVLFVDIRPEIAPGAIQQLVRNFDDPSIGCVTGELILHKGGQDATSAAVGSLYWRFEQKVRTYESAADSTVGVYGGFYAVRRELAVQQPAGMILDDMYQPLSIVCQGYRCVVDPDALVTDTWPKDAVSEFHRKVRTLAGNFQLIQLAPWTLTLRNRVLFQLVSHKLMRLVAPYLLALLLLSTFGLRAGSPGYAAFLALQMLALALAATGLYFKSPALQRIVAPLSALFMLNAAAMMGLYRFLFTRGPLWKIWKTGVPTVCTAATGTGNPSSTHSLSAGAARDALETACIDPHSREEHPMLVTSTKMVAVLIIGISALLSSSGCRGQAGRGTKNDSTGTHAYFPAGPVWTQEISRAPLDPQSSTIIGWLADAGGWGRGRMQIDFSLRVLQADASTPLVHFHKGAGFYANDSDVVTTVPLPALGGIEGGTGYHCNIGDNDCHFIVADRAHGKLYEAYQANLEDKALTANFLAVWDLNRVYSPSGRGDQCTSADAAGFPIAPLLFNADELAAGSINHAIRFILPNPRIRAKVFVHPATHAGGPRGPVTAPPMGAHFRLKASYDLSQLTPAAQVVARAMQKYGMFLSDGGNIALTAQSDADTQTKYADLDFGSHDLQALKVTDFEVVDGGAAIRLTDDCVRNR